MLQVDNTNHTSEQQDSQEQPITETLHLYVSREELQPSPSLLPIALSLLCLVVLFNLCMLSPTRQPLERRVIRLAAVYPPIMTYSASAPVNATGVKTYQATVAHGVLTLTNGSVVGQDLPAGIIFAGSSGVEVVTTSGVYVPAGSALGYGYATVSARAVAGGNQGNIPALSINAVYGTSLYIRNLSAFTGGKDAYAVKIITDQDRQTAISVAREALTAQAIHINTYLVRPCSEVAHERASQLTLVWSCQYFAFEVPATMHITNVKLVGKYVLVSVEYVARPSIIWFK